MKLKLNGRALSTTITLNYHAAVWFVVAIKIQWGCKLLSLFELISRNEPSVVSSRKILENFGWCFKSVGTNKTHKKIGSILRCDCHLCILTTSLLTATFVELSGWHPGNIWAQSVGSTLQSSEHRMRLRTYCCCT